MRKTQETSLKQVLKAGFEADKDRFVREWADFLRFPSISAGSLHERDCLNCARWLAGHLSKSGFQSRLVPTSGKPLVYAERKGTAGKPVVLFYGHYDVQPPDPEDQWTTPPFKPDLRNGRLYARGAQDNKGQVMYALKALESLVKLGRPMPTVKVLIEGEEESGSRGLKAAMPGLGDLIRADILMACDSLAVPSGAATLTMGLRGLVYLTVTVGGLKRDLHSGTDGGRVPNPATGLARLLATLHRPDGRVAVRGFYDGVKPPRRAERELANRHPLDARAFKRITGVLPDAGDRRFTPTERTGLRPCIDINGLSSGYSGAGVKTIIPASAMAKISARIVTGQDPKDVLSCIVRHLKEHSPKGLTLEIGDIGVSGGAMGISVRSPVVERARRVLRTLFEEEPAMLWEGASVPVIPGLCRVSGAEPLLVGFGSAADNMHAVDESFSVDQFRRGYLYFASFIGDL